MGSAIQIATRIAESTAYTLPYQFVLSYFQAMFRQPGLCGNYRLVTMTTGNLKLLWL